MRSRIIGVIRSMDLCDEVIHAAYDVAFDSIAPRRACSSARFMRRRVEDLGVRMALGYARTAHWARVHARLTIDSCASQVSQGRRGHAGPQDDAEMMRESSRTARPTSPLTGDSGRQCSAGGASTHAHITQAAGCRCAIRNLSQGLLQRRCRRACRLPSVAGTWRRPAHPLLVLGT